MGLTSPFQAGSRITAASLQFVAPLAAFKSADFNMQTGTGNTTLTNDPDLFIGLTASGIYVWFAMVVFAASATAKQQQTWTVPTGATGGYNPNLYVASGGGLQTTNSFLSYPTGFVQATLGTAMNQSVFMQGSVVMGATAGNLQFQFAQNVSDNSNCWTRAGSFLLAWRIA